MLAGAFGSLDSALNIAFPDLVDDLGLAVADLRWVVVCFVLSYGALLVTAGRLGDRFDHLRVLMIGGAASAVALAACATAPSYRILLIGRVGQGLATALVMAGAPALLATAGAGSTRTASIFQAAAGAGLALGPAVGGPLVALGGWRAVFWFRVPIAVALVGFGLAARRAGRPERPQTETRAEAEAEAPRAEPAPATATVDRPGRGFVVANALTALVNGTVFVTWLLVPALLLDELGLAATTGGLILATSPVATALASVAAGRWVERSGHRPVLVGGVAASTGGLAILMAVATLEPSVAAPAVVAALVIVGFGLGVFSVPNMAVVMGALPPDRQGTAGGLTLMMRTLGIVVGVNAAGLLFGSLEDGGRTFLDAFRITLAAAVVAGLLATGLALWSTRRGDSTDRGGSAQDGARRLRSTSLRSR